MNKKMKYNLLIILVLMMTCSLTGCDGRQKNSGDDITVTCYYFPNYHTGEPRNEAAKGVGWSEWELVKAADRRSKISLRYIEQPEVYPKRLTHRFYQ